MKTLGFALFLLLSNSSIAESVMEIITINHRPASDIQPLLAPLLEPQDRVIANGSNLIVRTSPARLVEIRRIIGQLDTPIENLIITVVQGKDISAAEFNAAAQLKAGATIQNSSINQLQLNARIRRTKSNQTIDSTQNLRTVNGQPAFIKVGRANPSQHIQIAPSGYGYPAISSHTEYIETSTGFAVTPRLVGKKQVLLDISPWSDQFNNRQIETQEAHTTLRAKLGEWIELGGNIEDSRVNVNGLLSELRSTRTQNLHILIKVEKQ